MIVFFSGAFLILRPIIHTGHTYAAGNTDIWFESSVYAERKLLILAG